MGKKRTGVCCYCGKEGPVTREHVPPKSFFPKSTSGLIVVDACEDCNNSNSKSDEEVRNVFSWLSMEKNAEANEVYRDKVWKAISKYPDRFHETTKHLRPTDRFDLDDESGLYLRSYGFTMNDVIEKCVRRWVKALFFHESQKLFGISLFSQVKFLDESIGNTVFEPGYTRLMKSHFATSDQTFQYSTTFQNGEWYYFLRFYNEFTAVAIFTYRELL